MCNKVDARIECTQGSCEYPYSEALYPDDYDDPLPCNASPEMIEKHIGYVEKLRVTVNEHPWDCKCLVCR